MFSRVKPQRPPAMNTKNSRITSGRRWRAKVTTWRMGASSALGARLRARRPSVYARRAVDEERAARDHPLAVVQPFRDLQCVARADAGGDAAEHEAVAVQRDPDARLRAAVDHRVGRNRDRTLRLAERDVEGGEHLRLEEVLRV